MRPIEWTSRFKRDYKREKKGQHRVALDVELSTVLSYLGHFEKYGFREWYV